MTTIAIHKDMHTLIAKKQEEMHSIYKMNIRISDILAVVIKNGIDNIEKLLCLGKEREHVKEDKFDIINMANKIGIEIIYTKENIGNLAKIPSRCGVYIITTESGRIYVGASLDMYNRITHHSIEEPIRSVNIYLTRNKSDADLLERRLICELDPELNTQKPMLFSFNMETKTVQIEDKIYFLVAKKRIEILEKYRTNITIFQIIDTLLRNYIDKIEELFRINLLY